MCTFQIIELELSIMEGIIIVTEKNMIIKKYTILQIWACELLQSLKAKKISFWEMLYSIGVVQARRVR